MVSVCPPVHLFTLAHTHGREELAKWICRSPPGRLLYGLSSGRGSSSSIGETQATTARLWDGGERVQVEFRKKKARKETWKSVFEET